MPGLGASVVNPVGHEGGMFSAHLGSAGQNCSTPLGWKLRNDGTLGLAPLESAAHTCLTLLGLAA